jgi:hypothetical protein
VKETEMSEFVMPVNNDANWAILDAFTKGYFEAAFFTECNSDNEELENATFSDVHISSLNAVIDDCTFWQNDNAALLNEAYERDYDAEQAGRDYWYTRNGHGVGFWDRKQLDENGLGEKLSNACRYREVYLYRGDNGRVYFS